MPLLQVASERLHTRIRPALTAAEAHPLLRRIYHVTRTVLTLVMLDYCAAVFALYKWQPSLAVWRAWGYYGHAVSAAIIAVTLLLDVAEALLAPRRAPPAKGKAKKA